MKVALFKRIAALVLCTCMLTDTLATIALAAESEPVRESDTVYVETGENPKEEETPSNSTEPSEPGDETPPVWDGTLDNSQAVNVASAEELEAALNAQASLIRITADFEIDRTLYVTYETVIYSDEKHTLTREATFGGDLFVVGNTEGTAKLVLGDSTSKLTNMLVIDGNKDNMTADVVGTVIFVASGTRADLKLFL